MFVVDFNSGWTDFNIILRSAVKWNAGTLRRNSVSLEMNRKRTKRRRVERRNGASRNNVYAKCWQQMVC